MKYKRRRDLQLVRPKIDEALMLRALNLIAVRTRRRL